MKTNRPTRRTRAIRERKERVKPDCEQAVRLCEEAAARIKAAGDDLAECWLKLGRELASGGSAIELLRKRAWCNVLELRLKERAQVLEKARLGVDAVWQDIMLAVRSRELLNRFLRKSHGELSVAHQVWPLLANTRPAPPRASAAPYKK
jgi:hypothetical protein